MLDADSLMSGETILRLVSAMERHPSAGLIQTLPLVINGETLFARCLQFGSRLYSRVAWAGLSWWSGAESSYWGHNAIIRVQAFADCCGLPDLKGPRPFGGKVMSHDALESALIRRGGWGVHLAPFMEGSYEEAPPTLPDFAARDRRWAQGNLQHLADGILEGHASAVLAASIFHFGEYTVPEAKAYMAARGIVVR